MESREAADVGEVEEVEGDRARSCRTAAPCVDATNRSRQAAEEAKGSMHLLNQGTDEIKANKRRNCQLPDNNY